MGILLRGVVTAIAIAIAAFFVPGIHWGLVDYGLGEPGRYLSLLLTAIVLGLVNAIVRPVLVIVSLIPQLGFSVDGFVAALIGSIIISLVSAVLSKVVR